MNIPLLVEKCSIGVQKILAIVAEVIAGIFAVVILIYGGVQIYSLAMGQMTSSLGVAVGVFYIMLPVCGILNISYVILNIIGIIDGSISLTASDEAAQALEKVEKEGQ